MYMDCLYITFFLSKLNLYFLSFLHLLINNLLVKIYFKNMYKYVHNFADIDKLMQNFLKDMSYLMFFLFQSQM